MRLRNVRRYSVLNQAMRLRDVRRWSVLKQGCAAMCGAETACDATRESVNHHEHLSQAQQRQSRRSVTAPTVLRAPYAISSNDTATVLRAPYTISSTDTATVLRAPYPIPGTDIAPTLRDLQY